jgi:hypothetical protein
MTLLVPLLQGFFLLYSNLRIASFTQESRVDADTMPALRNFYERNMNSLETIVVPTYSDEAGALKQTGIFKPRISLRRKTSSKEHNPRLPSGKTGCLGPSASSRKAGPLH